MRVLLALLVAATLAGCADRGAPAEEEPDAFKDLSDVDADKGVIRGVVVNQDFVPVEGATIRLLTNDETATSDAEGAFVFADLEPGTYFLETTAPAHGKVQSSEDVVAGVAKPDVHQIRLIYTPPAIPYIEEIPWRFWMDASANVGGNRVVLGNFLGEGTYGASLEFAPNATWVQSELAWGFQQPLAEHMRMDMAVRDGDNANLAGGSAQGPSPISRGFGDNADETGQLLSATRAAYTLFVGAGDPVPAGATAGQELNLYLHVFHGFTPTEGWLFSEDGAHDLP